MGYLSLENLGKSKNIRLKAEPKELVKIVG